MNTLTPPDNEHSWFPSYLLPGFNVASIHPGGRVHDFMDGWGQYSPCGEWFYWESGWVPRPTVHVEVKFDKVMFPTIKNYKWPEMDLRAILMT